jgi:uncharacterized protein
MTAIPIDPPAWFAIQYLGVPLPAVLGGLLIGLAAVVLYLSIGRIAGISGIFFSAFKEGGAWRWLFLGGIVAGAGVVAWFLPSVRGVTRPDPGIAILIVAGLLVGWGTRLGSGCTSGHGVCGLGRLAPRSLVAVLAFMVAGIFTASLLRHWLGVPA